MKRIFRSNVVKVIGIVLLSATILGFAGNLFVKSTASNNSDTMTNLVFDHVKHEGGVYYKSNYSGLRYSFINGNPDLNSFGGTAGIFEVVNNDYFSIKSSDANSQRKEIGITAYYGQSPVVSENEYIEHILEFDMMFYISSFVDVDYNFFKLYFNDDTIGTKVYWFYDSNRRVFEIPKSGTTSLNDSVITVYNTHWNNYRFVYRLEDSVMYVRMYLNGEYIYDFTMNNNFSGNDVLDKVVFSLYNPYVGDRVFLDNIYMGYRVVSK